jgi:predicted O-methyltransferase YrrM
MIKTQFTQNKAGWKKSFLTGLSQDENEDYLPWMTYPAIDFLQKTITKNHRIFEFGLGTSTLFFAKRARKVTSLETNKKWMELVKKMLVQAQHDVDITLMEDGLTNNLYENFPQNCGEKFDFIVIDSLKRFECAKNSINALNQGGSIILDDSERPNYKKIFDFFAKENFMKQDFIGIEPGRLRVKKTTIFTK